MDKGKSASMPTIPQHVTSMDGTQDTNQGTVASSTNMQGIKGADETARTSRKHLCEFCGLFIDIESPGQSWITSNNDLCEHTGLFMNGESLSEPSTSSHKGGLEQSNVNNCTSGIPAACSDCRNQPPLPSALPPPVPTMPVTVNCSRVAHDHHYTQSSTMQMTIPSLKESVQIDKEGVSNSGIKFHNQF